MFRFHLKKIKSISQTEGSRSQPGVVSGFASPGLGQAAVRCRPEERGQATHRGNHEQNARTVRKLIQSNIS